MSHPIPTVYIVDDDRSVRESLGALLRQAGCQAETFGCAEAFLARPAIAGPSCLLLDVTSQDFDGMSLLGHLSQERVEVPIIAITSRGEVPMTVRAMKQGAIEVLMKPLDTEVVLAAVREAVAQSGAVLHREAGLRDLRARYARLSSREREVMLLVVTGLLNKQVAGQLGISEITVKAHRGRVMRKMQAQSLAELVTMAASLRLPSPGLMPSGCRRAESSDLVLHTPWQPSAEGLGARLALVG